MPSIIDIHPHVICPDTTRYPLAPLGGTQSTWSRDRPTSFETMIKETSTVTFPESEQKSFETDTVWSPAWVLAGTAKAPEIAPVASLVVPDIA